jgi:hypothetical protein
VARERITDKTIRRCDGIGIASPGRMNAEKTQGYVNHQPNDPTARHGNGSPSAKRNDFARRVKFLIAGFPSNLDAQIKRRPYASLGIASAIGMGTGILLGSRILRSVLASAVSYAVVELGRAYLRQHAAPAYDMGTPRR